MTFGALTAIAWATKPLKGRFAPRGASLVQGRADVLAGARSMWLLVPPGKCQPKGTSAGPADANPDSPGYKGKTINIGKDGSFSYNGPSVGQSAPVGEVFRGHLTVSGKFVTSRKMTAHVVYKQGTCSVTENIIYLYLSANTS